MAQASSPSNQEAKYLCRYTLQQERQAFTDCDFDEFSASAEKRGEIPVDLIFIESLVVTMAYFFSADSNGFGFVTEKTQKNEFFRTHHDRQIEFAKKEVSPKAAALRFAALVEKTGCWKKRGGGQNCVAG